jgi:hypothetical protein
MLNALHRAFWRLTVPQEQTSISTRFAAERARLEPLIAPLAPKG